MIDSQRLLRDYVEKGSESAFRELVACYINLVYGTALRLVNGDTQLAEDVTQMVFINLANKAPTLSCEVMLGGWLHQNTFYTATRVMRAEHRRKTREREAMEMNTPDLQTDWLQIAPILDEAITQLGNEDRTAILLRFFEQRDFRSVGEALGTNEDAARMRVNRALEKLHSLLVHQGGTLSIAALGTALVASAATAAPAGLAGSVSGVALAGAAAGMGTTLTVFKVMANAKLKLTVATLLVAGAVSTLVVQHQSKAKLREENQSYRQQIAQLTADHANPASNVASVTEPAPMPGDQFQELLRLRGEVGTLRQQTNDLARLLQQKQDSLSRAEAQSQAVTNQISGEDQYILRQTHASDAVRTMLIAIKEYTSNHGGQYPASFDDLTAAGSLQKTNFAGNLGLDDFTMEKEGTLDFESNRICLSLRVPIPRPGLPSVQILGVITKKGVMSTRVMNVSPQ